MKNFFREYGLYLLISLYFLVVGVFVVAEDTPFLVFGTVFLWLLAVMSAQVVVINILSRINSSTLLRDSLLSIAVSVNAIAFYVSFFESFVSLSAPIKGLVFLVTFGAVSAVFYIHEKRRSAGLLIKQALFAMLVINTLFSVSKLIPEEEVISDYVNESLSPYSSIILGEKPNVHLISIDSLLPETLAKRHMGIETEYNKLMKDIGAIIFRNLFASQAPTGVSLSSISQLADPSFSGTDGFSGRVLEPLYYIFKNNGYRIASGYSSGKRVFGDKGPAVDEYVNSNKWGMAFSESALCKHQGGAEKYYQLFGFCLLAKSLDPDSSARWEDFVMDRVTSKGESDSPWLTFHYMYSVIGHTPLSYDTFDNEDLNDYRRFFYKKQKSFSSSWLRDFVARIQANDPNSIVFIFGDHGPWLSRTMDPEKKTGFYILDRYGIFGAVLNTDNRCVEENNLDHYFDRFGTPERVIAGIIRCLSDNPEALDAAVNFREAYFFNKLLYE